MTPEELIIQAKNGDRPAITRLLHDHRGLVASVACRLVRDSEQRKDVIQNIFVRVITQIHSFANLCRFSTWLYRISLNECIEHGRKETRAKEQARPFDDTLPEAIDSNAPDGFGAATSAELRSTIAHALGRLPLDQKTAFSLFYFGGYSGKEGAEALSISEANFFMKLKAARSAVRRELSSRGWSV